jgi:hypothetical protein
MAREWRDGLLLYKLIVQEEKTIRRIWIKMFRSV